MTVGRINKWGIKNKGMNRGETKNVMMPRVFICKDVARYLFFTFDPPDLSQNLI